MRARNSSGCISGSHDATRQLGPRRDRLSVVGRGQVVVSEMHGPDDGRTSERVDQSWVREGRKGGRDGSEHSLTAWIVDKNRRMHPPHLPVLSPNSLLLQPYRPLCAPRDINWIARGLDSLLFPALCLVRFIALPSFEATCRTADQRTLEIFHHTPRQPV